VSATLTIRAVARPLARRELVQALVGWATVARREQPDLEVGVGADLESPDGFLVVAHWPTPVALDEHVRSDAFGALLGGFDLLASAVQVRVGTPLETYGDQPLVAIRRTRAESLSAPRREVGPLASTGLSIR